MTTFSLEMFTRRRFQRLPEAMQHKYCALLAEQLFQENSSSLLQEYRLFLTWMELPLPLPHTEKEWADRYDWHRTHAGKSAQKLPFLPSVREGDRCEGSPLWPISVYLDNLRSAHNVGSIVRTVEAFGFAKIFLSPQTPPLSHPQVQKTAMGTETTVLSETIPSLSYLPGPLIAVETSDEAPALHAFSFPECCTIAVGNEAYGCSEELLMRADAMVTIPLRGRKNSLNVANTFAIVAAEIARQRSNFG